MTTKDSSTSTAAAPVLVAEQPSPVLTRKQLRERLDALGYPITASYFDFICLPSVGEGPPVERRWGRRCLYRLDRAIAWAEARADKSTQRAA